MTPEQKKEFDIISKQIIKFMAENFHPHCTLIANSTNCEILEGIANEHTDEFLTD